MKQNLMEKPKEPLNRILREEGGHGTCEKCGSSMLRIKWWGFFGPKKCIHPKCGYIK